jgi:hypothetical protein
MLTLTSNSPGSSIACPLDGSEPTNAASVLHVTIPSTSGGAEIRFGAISNHTYSVRYRDTPGGDPMEAATGQKII